MALLNPGAFPDTAWCSQAWQEDSWPEYGAVAPPAAPTVKRGMMYRRRRRFPTLLEDREFLELMVTYLELD